MVILESVPALEMPICDGRASDPNAAGSSDNSPASATTNDAPMEVKTKCCTLSRISAMLCQLITLRAFVQTSTLAPKSNLLA